MITVIHGPTGTVCGLNPDHIVCMYADGKGGTILELTHKLTGDMSGTRFYAYDDPVEVKRKLEIARSPK